MRGAGGRAVLLGPDGRARELTVRQALAALRASLDGRNQTMEAAVQEAKDLRLRLLGVRRLIEADADTWKPVDWFDGLGLGADVPLGLRTNVRMKNRHLSKTQVENRKP